MPEGRQGTVRKEVAGEPVRAHHAGTGATDNREMVAPCIDLRQARKILLWWETYLNGRTRPTGRDADPTGADSAHTPRNCRRKRPEALVAISFCLNGQISRRFGPYGVPREVEAVRVAHYLKLRALK